MDHHLEKMLPLVVGMRIKWWVPELIFKHLISLLGEEWFVKWFFDSKLSLASAACLCLYGAHVTGVRGQPPEVERKSPEESPKLQDTETNHSHWPKMRFRYFWWFLFCLLYLEFMLCFYSSQTLSLLRRLTHFQSSVLLFSKAFDEACP